MKLNSKNRNWFWAVKIIHRLGGDRERLIIADKNKKMWLSDDKIVTVFGSGDVCRVYIPEFTVDSCQLV